MWDSYTSWGRSFANLDGFCASCVVTAGPLRIVSDSKDRGQAGEPPPDYEVLERFHEERESEKTPEAMTEDTSQPRIVEGNVKISR